MSIPKECDNIKGREWCKNCEIKDKCPARWTVVTLDKDDKRKQ